MGYTHYYDVTNSSSDEWNSAWRQLVEEDVPRIIDQAEVRLSGPTEYHDIQTPPLIDIKKGININGVGSDAHEPFVLTKSEGGFCKTSQKGYDVVVATILLRAFMLAPNSFSVSSDGLWEDDWNWARSNYEQLWPNETPRCPWDENEGLVELESE